MEATDKTLLATEGIMLKYHFSEDEQMEIGKKLAAINAQIEQIEMDKKDAVAQFKAEVEALVAETKLLSSHLNTGYRQERVQCYFRVDPERRVKKYWTKDQNLDTDEPIKVEDLPRGYQFTA